MLLDFFNTVANLKTISRQGWIDKLGINNPESVSDHTFSLTVMTLIFAELQKLDTEKAIKMSLIHDLAESKIGDFMPDQLPKIQKNKLETDAMKNILNDLPPNLRNDMFNLWNEFLEQKTPESLLIHDLDKLEMALQAKIYEKRFGCNIQIFLDSAETQISNPKIKELFMKITQQ